MLKKLVHQTALRVEDRADRMFHRTGTGREVDPYIGYATPDHIVVRGRVLSMLRHAVPTPGQSRALNFRQMLAMFMTDEVRGAVVRCGDHMTHSEDEGYFNLLLPRDGRVGWSVEYVQVDDITAQTACPVYVPDPDAKFMIISDIDDTVLETGAYSLMRNLYTSFSGNAVTRRVFPDAMALMTALVEGGKNPAYYVSSSPWNLHDFLADIFENAKLPRGPIFLRDLGLSKTKFVTEGHGHPKGASIDLILAANPTLRAILLGDTGQHDAQIYKDAIARHPGRIMAVGLRVSGLNDSERADLVALKASDVPCFMGANFDDFVHDISVSLPNFLAREGAVDA
ncbi:phosphatase domain-containing protein [Yoonia sp. MH D7]